MEKRLYKIEEGKKLCGVCGGIAEYFNVDPIIVRLLFMALSPIYGSGLIAYLVCALMIPEGEEASGENEGERNGESEKDNR